MLTENVIAGGDPLDHFLEQELNKGLLRFTTAGSVDDGKSTLIGRLLHDCKAVYEDQLDSVKKSRINRSGRAVDFSLLTDGLRAEREQGITIDVAYRYFSTPRSRFIIADTPGHEQYTRNMATGASTADLAVILVDATKGILPQTRRHTFIASLLGISHVLVAINKMDLIGYREEVFLRLRQDFLGLADQLGISSVQCVPISALDGENIVSQSDKTPWYGGPTLLKHLESVPIRRDVEMEALRFPVQLVIRPNAHFRGFAGRVASGTVRPGDEVLALPSRQRTKVESIVSFDGELEEATSSQSVLVKLADEIDLSRGDALVSPENPPFTSTRFRAMVVWLHPTPLELNRMYLAKHAGQLVKAKATQINFRIDVNHLTEHTANQLAMNEIASIEFETNQALFFDPYQLNRTTGSLILIDPLTNATVGAVMIRENLSPETKKTDHLAESAVSIEATRITLEERIQQRGYRPAILAVTGDKAWADSLERVLFARGFETVLLDLVEIPTGALRTVLTILWRSGLIVICFEETGLHANRALFGEIAREFCFDFSVAAVSDDGIDFRRAISIAETLRITDTETGLRRN